MENYMKSGRSVIGSSKPQQLNSVRSQDNGIVGRLNVQNQDPNLQILHNKISEVIDSKVEPELHVSHLVQTNSGLNLGKTTTSNSLIQIKSPLQSFPGTKSFTYVKRLKFHKQLSENLLEVHAYLPTGQDNLQDTINNFSNSKSTQTEGLQRKSKLPNKFVNTISKSVNIGSKSYNKTVPKSYEELKKSIQKALPKLCDKQLQNFKKKGVEESTLTDVNQGQNSSEELLNENINESTAGVFRWHRSPDLKKAVRKDIRNKSKDIKESVGQNRKKSNQIDLCRFTQLNIPKSYESLEKSLQQTFGKNNFDVKEKDKIYCDTSSPLKQDYPHKINRDQKEFIDISLTVADKLEETVYEYNISKSETICEKMDITHLTTDDVSITFNDLKENLRQILGDIDSFVDKDEE